MRISYQYLIVQPLHAEGTGLRMGSLPSTKFYALLYGSGHRINLLAGVKATWDAAATLQIALLHDSAAATGVEQ